MGTIFQSIEILSKEKGIDPQIVIDAVKDAMLVAARKHYRTMEDMVAEFDEHTGAIQIYAVKKVVEAVEDPVNQLTVGEAKRIDPAAEVGSEVRIAKSTDILGRISAQTAKQVILQKVREAERETIYLEYSGRVGELVNCSVKRIEGQDLMVDIGKTEARLPKKEQSKLESFSVGDRVRCVIKSVEKTGKNPGVVVSRAAPELVMRLFEQEVPEIYDNTIIIKGCAREAGERTKIAVHSRDRDVDSVGACVGMKGMRVQSIIRELRGEKIDIIEFSEDPVTFATHALSPAKISRVSIVDAGEKHMEVIVDDSQLSLAIGKKGQNVRLGAKLLGWRIDIKSEEEKRQEVESQMAALVVSGAPVSVLADHGLADKVIEKLIEADIGTVEKLGAMTPEQLEEIQGIGPKTVEAIQLAVNSYYAQFEEPAPESAPAGEMAGVETPAAGQPAEAEGGPAEAEGEQPAEGEQLLEAEQPAESEGAQPAESEGAQPAEAEGGQPAEGEQLLEAEQPAESEGGQPQDSEPGEPAEAAEPGTDAVETGAGGSESGPSAKPGGFVQTD